MRLRFSYGPPIPFSRALRVVQKIECTSTPKAVTLLIAIAVAACDGGIVQASGAPAIEIHSPGLEVVVGATGASGSLEILGEVVGNRELEELTVHFGGRQDQVVALSGRRDGFEVEVGLLPLGEHDIVLRARDEAGQVAPAVTVRVRVSPAVREVPMPESAFAAFPVSLDEKGSVTGYWMPESETADWLAFEYHNGMLRDLSLAGDVRSTASARNDGGEVIGYASADRVNTYAVRWRNGIRSPLLTTRSTASDIAADGTVIGSVIQNERPLGFILRNGQLTTIGEGLGDFASARSINAKGQVLGTAYRTRASTAFVHDRGGSRPLPGLSGAQSVGRDINDDGVAVGYADVAEYVAFRAVVWEDGSVREISPAYLGTGSSYAYGISNRKVVVGELGILGGIAFAYHEGSVVQLEEVVGIGSHYIIAAYDVTDGGEIVAVGVRRDDPSVLLPLLVAVPGGLEAALRASRVEMAAGANSSHPAAMRNRERLSPEILSLLPDWRRRLETP